jgi:tRNA (adenine9-N1/guanine9-N1)-methyltransferase
MVYVERPLTALFEILMGKGVYRLGFKPFYELKRLETLGFQYVAVEMLVNEYNIVYDPAFKGKVAREDSYRGVKFKLFVKDGDLRPDAIISHRVSQTKALVTWREVAELLPTPPLPLFVVDFSILSSQETIDVASIKIQVEECIERVREYLWDPHLAITSADKSMADWIHSVAGKNKIIITPSKPSELLWSMDADKVTIIRQDAPHPLTPNDVLSSDAFLIGGVQDSVSRPGMGRVFDNLVPWGIPRRIELKGSVVGVPDKVNKIVEILLKARYKYGGEVERAVISSMTKKNVITRLYSEIVKRTERSGGEQYVSIETYYDIAKWLPITREDFIKVAEKAGVKVKQ